MKNALRMFAAWTALALVISSPAALMHAAADDNTETPKDTYIILNKLNKISQGRETHNLALIKIEPMRELKDVDFGYHSDGSRGTLLLPTFTGLFTTGDEPWQEEFEKPADYEERCALYNQIYENVSVGDVIEAIPMAATQTSSWNILDIGEVQKEEDFVRLGNVFTDEAYAKYRAVINGQDVITMTSVEGTKYYALPNRSFVTVHFVPEYELLPIGDTDGSDTVDASDAAQILAEAASLGSRGRTSMTGAQQWSADVNRDGYVNASDAAIVLIYAAESGAGTFSGTFEEYLNR